MKNTTKTYHLVIVVQLSSETWNALFSLLLKPPPSTNNQQSFLTFLHYNPNPCRHHVALGGGGATRPLILRITFNHSWGGWVSDVAAPFLVTFFVFDSGTLAGWRIGIRFFETCEGRLFLHGLADGLFTGVVVCRGTGSWNTGYVLMVRETFGLVIVACLISYLSRFVEICSFRGILKVVVVLQGLIWDALLCWSRCF